MLAQKIKFAFLSLFILVFAFCYKGLAQEKNQYNSYESDKDPEFFYTIQKGDTLSALSEKFYSSEWDWPGLWEMNDQIKNPHWIYPGKKIRVFLKKKSEIEPIIVKPEKSKSKNLPDKITASFSFPKIDYVGFIRNKAQKSLGTVIKEEDNHLMMTVDDIIYIKPSGKSRLIPGRLYHIFTTEQVKEKINDKIFKGVKHIIKARIKILEHKKTYVKALITNAYGTVSKNDMVMRYYKRKPTLKVEEQPGPIDAKIICSENNSLMIHDYSIAFINKGRGKVKPGQIYTVSKKNKTAENSLWPSNKKPIKFDELESGKLIVLRTEDIASTVMILSSQYAIYKNNIVR